MRNKFIFTLILVLIFSLSNSPAQTSKPKPKTISAGIVNGRAISLPKPEYPAAAAALKASGAVNVQVIIDEEGNVISATAVSGHPLLQQAAERVARQAKFSPTKLSGEPVKVTGVIIYNFVAAINNEEKVKILGLSTFLSIIHGSASDLRKLNEFFGTEEPIEDEVKETIEEFPNFAKELAPLAALEKSPSENRLEIINKVSSSVRGKLRESDVWQFELGKNFGEILAQFFLAKNGDKFDFNKLEESALRLNLTKIKDLTYSAPPDFPTDVLEKFKRFATVDDKKQLVAPENLQELWEKLEVLLETISPDSTK